MADRNMSLPPLRLVTPGEAPARARDLEWALLMARAQQGDGVAYARLLREITPLLRARALRRLRTRHDAEDGVQDVLLTLHAIRHTYDPARPFVPWLVAIADHRLIDGLRRQMRRSAREAALDDDVEIADEHGRADANVEHPALLRAIDALPEGQRQAIHLLKLREMSLADAARHSGQTIGSLKTATHRAMMTLRAVMQRTKQK
ncbi:MAG: sigma-70 family RNA polymerase sigma factor [Hyphomicrobiales bacterium]|nr:sigma-70 family RNA polymerase sigma factor [Hyphomicrobiales bacterium]